jgi:hypothetical protein
VLPRITVEASALVVDGMLVPMELARLPYGKGELEDQVGERALLRLGKHRWRRRVVDIVNAVAAAFVVDEVVLGGGNARHLKDLPKGIRPGSNALAMVGGERLWREPPFAERLSVGDGASRVASALRIPSQGS